MSTLATLERCGPCASHVAHLRTLASQRGDGALLRQVEALQEEIASKATGHSRPPFLDLARYGDTWEDERRRQVERTHRWLEAKALAWLDVESLRLASALDQRLAALWAQGIRDRSVLRGQMSVMLKERLEVWRADAERRANEVYRQAAEALSRWPPAPFPAESRFSYRLAQPASFLDAGKALRAVIERVSVGDRVRQRLYREIHGEAQLLLRANVTRIVDDLAQRLEDGIRRLA